MNKDRTQKAGMPWSFKVATIFGIGVYLHLTFILLLAAIAASNWSITRNAVVTAISLLPYVGMFGCVLLHEYGHILTARRFGIDTSDVTLLPIGGVARLEQPPKQPTHELWITIAGPAVNVVISGLLWLVLTLTDAWPVAKQPTHIVAWLAAKLAWFNLVMVCFNLLPAFPMDGGRILRALLALRSNQQTATRVAVALGKIVAVGFVIFGFYGHPILILTGLFVWTSGNQELNSIRSPKSKETRARQITTTKIQTCQPTATLAHAASILRDFQQPYLPIVDGDRLVGMVKRIDLLKYITEKSNTAAVGDCMDSSWPTLDANALLPQCIAEIDFTKGAAVAVTENGRFLGLIYPEDMLAFLSNNDTSKDTRR